MTAPSAGTAVPGTQPWPAPRLNAPVDAVLEIPGSKSLTNRYLVLAALADGPSILRSPLHSRDSALMIGALRALGAEITEIEGEGRYGPDLRVVPFPQNNRDIREDREDTVRRIDCGLAGTVMRFVPPLAALRRGSAVFDGDPQARHRPMAGTIDALRLLGVAVDDGGSGSLPFTVAGEGSVEGGHLVIDAGASSQFVTSLLLAAPAFTRGLHLEHAGGPLPSLEHIDMTVKVLRSLGVRVDDSEPLQWRVSPGPISAFDVLIEPDLSNAGPFLAAAVVTGGTVRIRNWPAATTQVGDDWRVILPKLGASVELAGGELTVTGGSRITGGRFADTSELAPTVAALCALAETPSVLTGIAHLRGHETDRLAALVTEINALGGDAEETADGLLIRPARLHGGVFSTYEDHRMATAGAVIGLAVEGIQVENIGTTAKTLPQFPELWAGLAATARTEESSGV